MADPASAVNINTGNLDGSFATIPRMLDEFATLPGTEGIMLTFDKFVEGIENVGRQIRPLMTLRSAGKLCHRRGCGSASSATAPTCRSI